MKTPEDLSKRCLCATKWWNRKVRNLRKWVRGQDNCQCPYSQNILHLHHPVWPKHSLMVNQGPFNTPTTGPLPTGLSTLAYHSFYT